MAGVAELIKRYEDGMKQEEIKLREIEKKRKNEVDDATKGANISVKTKYYETLAKSSSKQFETTPSLALPEEEVEFAEVIPEDYAHQVDEIPEEEPEILEEEQPLEVPPQPVLAEQKDKNMSRSKRLGKEREKMAEEWKDYLGMSYEDLLYACEGFTIHIFVNKFGGSLRTVKVRFDLNRGNYNFIRPNKELSVLGIGLLADVVEPPATISYFKKLRGDAAVSEDSIDVVSSCPHLLCTYKISQRRKNFKRRQLKFMFCFDSEYDRDIFLYCSKQYSSSVAK